ETRSGRGDCGGGAGARAAVRTEGAGRAVPGAWVWVSCIRFCGPLWEGAAGKRLLHSDGNSGPGRSIISRHFIQAVTSKFLYKCLGKHYSHHSLAYYASGRNYTYITTLIAAFIYILAGCQVYRG